MNCPHAKATFFCIALLANIIVYMPPVAIPHSGVMSPSQNPPLTKRGTKLTRSNSRATPLATASRTAVGATMQSESMKIIHSPRDAADAFQSAFDLPSHPSGSSPSRTCIVVSRGSRAASASTTAPVVSVLRSLTTIRSKFG